MQKKVLFVITKSNWGGAQRYVFDLATRLPKEEFEAVVAFGGTGEKGAEVGALAQKLQEANIRSIVVSSFVRNFSLAQDFSAVPELVKIFKTEKPDIVHLNSSKAGGVGALAARLAGVKNIIFTSHGLPWDEDRNIVAKAFILALSWATFLLCHRVIAISEDNAKRARRLLGCANKVTLIHNGIAPIVFLAREAARQTLNLPQEKIVIGAVGELTWNKGYHTLVRAAGILKREGKEFLLSIIGEGEERLFIETLIAEEDIADRVVLHGFVPEAATYLKAFDIFSLSSIKEGLPYVLLEAAQAHLPVVGSRISGIQDIAQEWVSGLLFEPKNEHALAVALRSLIDDAPLRERLSQALFERSQKEFSLEAMVENTAQLYRSAS